MLGLTLDHFFKQIKIKQNKSHKHLENLQKIFEVP